MKLLPLAALAALLAAGCSATAPQNHWRLTSVPSRVQYHFFGYEPQMDGSYWNRFGDDAGSIWQTSVRHFWLGNPDHPLRPASTARPPKPQPPNVEFKVKNP